MNVRGWLVRLTVALMLAGALVGWTWHRGRSIRAARDAFERKAWLQAIVHARAHLADQPQDDEARRIVARSHTRLAQWADAEAAFAAIAAPTADDLRERGDGLIRQSQWFEASYIFEQLLNVRPDDPHALQQLAVLRSKQGRELEGIGLAQRLCELPGHESVGHAMLATLHQGRDNLIGAVESWKKVIELDPESKTLPRSIAAEKVRLNLVDSLLNLGRWEEALPYLEFVEVRRPNDTQVLFLRGWICLYQGENEKALMIWEQTLDQAPDSADVLTKLGSLKLQLGEAEEALPLLERSLGLRPEDFNTHSALAAVHRQLGNAELSRQHTARSEQLRAAREQKGKAERFMKLDPSSPRGKLAMAIRLARDGKWQEAEQWVRDVLRENSEDIDAQQLLRDIMARRVPPEPNSP